jgi:O-antigen/teichoic acid export membrane protein
MPARALSEHRDLVAGVVAQMLQYGAALLLLPLIATRLSPTEIGVWYVFVTIQGLSTLVDFGFQPNIARAFAAAFAGSPELLREGVSPATANGPNLPLAAGILASSRRLYLVLATVTLALLLTAGTLYVSALVEGEASAPGPIRIAWSVFAAGIAINLYFLWAAPLLMGSDRVYQNYLSTIITRGGFSVLGAAALLVGGGLVALAAANLIAVAAGAAFVLFALRPVLRDLAAVSTPAEGHVLGSLWYNSSRTGLVLVGGFLINRANVLVFSTFVGLAASAQYAFTLQILSAGMAVAQLPTMVAVPRMTALRVQGRMDALARLFLIRHAFLLVAFALFAAAVGVVGQWALTLIGSHVSLMPPAIFALFSVVLLLELNSINAGYLLSTGNRVPFVRSALVSGAAVLAGSLGAVWLGWGVAGAVAAQGLVQLAYNNWKWPLEAWKELRAWI